MTHPGQPTMLSNARDLYWWPGMQEQVINFCEACDSCSLYACSRMSAKPQTQEDINVLSPMEVISLDLHAHKGKTYISAQDRASGYR